MKPKHKTLACVIAIFLAGGTAFARDGAFGKIAKAISDTPTGIEVTAQTQVEVGFSPGYGAEALVLKTIGGAQDTILLSAYSFTSKKVAEALVHAIKRGVKVYAVLDSSNRTEKMYSSATFLANSGAAVRIDSEHAIHHNKVLVVDNRHVQTGSFNFSTAAASRNAENVITVWNTPDLARAYAVDFRRHWDHASDYTARY